MPGQKTCRLGGDHASLDAGQYRLGFVERQTDHLQPVVALVEMQDLALADHAAVVGHDPELDLNTHACPKGCHCRSAYLSAGDAADHPRPPIARPTGRNQRRRSQGGPDLTWRARISNLTIG